MFDIFYDESEYDEVTIFGITVKRNGHNFYEAAGVLKEYADCTFEEYLEIAEVADMLSLSKENMIEYVSEESIWVDHRLIIDIIMRFHPVARLHMLKALTYTNDLCSVKLEPVVRQPKPATKPGRTRSRMRFDSKNGSQYLSGGFSILWKE
jgi:hypothetical protein